VGDGFVLPSPEGFTLEADGQDLRFEGTDVRLDRDLIVRLGPRGVPEMRLSAFRNPEGALPDGLALAPWERPSEIPPEKAGFCPLELLPRGAGPRAEGRAAERAPVTLAVVFDTSLSGRWSALEIAYARLVRTLQSLTARDRFAVVAFDRAPD